MKKIVGIIAVALLVVGIPLLVAGNAVAQTPAFVLKAGHDNPESGSYHVGFLYFAKIVSERTGGKVKVDVFPSAQLGNEVKLLESVRLGTVDFATCGAANASTVVPELGFFSVSYLFAGQEHFDRAMAPEGEISKALEKIVADKKSGARMVGLYTIGKRSIVNKVKPIKTVEDLKGMKIRVMASPIEQKVWTALGAQPTTIPTPETYSALQTGVVQGAENAPIIILGWKFYEPAKYYSLTEHQFFMAPVFMSERTYQKLPADLRTIVLKCIQDASVYERQQDLKINENALEQLKTLGCQINSDVNKESFINRLKGIQDETADQLKVKNILDLIRKARK